MIPLSKADAPALPGILLMAGRSSRLGFPKALLPFGPGTLIEWTLGRALASRLSAVILVLGDHRVRIERAVTPFIGHPKLKILFNPAFGRGMSTSVRQGLEAVDPTASGVMFLLGDQPLLQVATINKLLHFFSKSGAPIVVPLYGRRSGNPVVFRRDLFQDLNAQQGDVGGRELIKKYGAGVHFLPVRPLYQGLDLDTWEDYKKIRDRLDRLPENRAGFHGPDPGRKKRAGP